MENATNQEVYITLRNRVVYKKEIKKRAYIRKNATQEQSPMIEPKTEPKSEPNSQEDMGTTMNALGAANAVDEDVVLVSDDRNPNEIVDLTMDTDSITSSVQEVDQYLVEDVDEEFWVIDHYYLEE
ncbi:hypothetical protein KR018_009351 [Drosophila ironensis]|nr:hypothetical protein KR018_009351 [Drosophila ironensis]